MLVVKLSNETIKMGIFLGTLYRAQDGDSTVIFDHLEEWMCLGANIVGGCCRVTPSKNGSR